MIDWTRIEALEEEVGADALPEIVAIFLEETDAAVDGLRSIATGAARADPPAGMAARMHFVAGSAGQLGLTRLCALAAGAERAAAGGAAVDPAPIVEAYDAGRGELLSGLTARA